VLNDKISYVVPTTHETKWCLLYNRRYVVQTTHETKWCLLYNRRYVVQTTDAEMKLNKSRGAKYAWDLMVRTKQVRLCGANHIQVKLHAHETEWREILQSKILVMQTTISARRKPQMGWTTQIWDEGGGNYLGVRQIWCKCFRCQTKVINPT
jgi:hypothetical protein